MDESDLDLRTGSVWLQVKNCRAMIAASSGLHPGTNQLLAEENRKLQAQFLEKKREAEELTKRLEFYSRVRPSQNQNQNP